MISAIDHHDNVVIAGHHFSDFMITKFNSTGELSWFLRYNYFGQDDIPTAITTDQQGNIYVTGYISENNGDNDILTLKINPSGKKIWESVYNGAGNGDDEPVGIGLDDLGNLYVVGTSKSPGWHSSNFNNLNWSTITVLKYSQQLGAALVVGEGGAKPGDTTRVALNVSNGQGMAGLEGCVSFDSNVVEIFDIELTDLTQNFVLVDSVVGGKACFALSVASGLAAPTGNVLEFVVRANPNASAGETSALTLEDMRLVNENAEDIQVSATNGQFQVLSPASLTLEVSPDTAFVARDSTFAFSAVGRDSSGKIVAVNPAWRVSGGIGGVSPQNGASATFAAVERGEGFVVAEQTPAADSAYVRVGVLGDVSGEDGAVTVGDAVLALRISMFKLVPTPYQFWASELDGDEEVTSGDALKILYIVLGRLLPKLTKTAGSEVALNLQFQFIENENSVLVHLNVEQPADLNAANFFFKYDPAKYQFLDFQQGQPKALVALAHDRPGEIRLGLISDKGIFDSENGRIATIKLKALEKPPNSMPVEITKARLFDRYARPVEILNLATGFIENNLPAEFALPQNFPNPFNPETSIQFSLPEAGHVTLTIYDVNGRRVRRLLSQKMPAGIWREMWDGQDEQGGKAASGLYFYEIVVDGGKWRRMKKMLLVK